MSPPALRITIITSTLNCAASLERTAASIRAQTYRNLQWIVADGASTDGTLEVIRRNSDIISHWFSETDKGIYDAWNKACRLIYGEWVLFLGAGDLLADRDTSERAARQLAGLSTDILVAYGNVVQKAKGQVLYRYAEVDLGSWQLCRPALPPHQGAFHRAQVLRQPGPFDESYRIVADSKLLLQIVRPGNVVYLDMDVAEMEAGGVSSDPAWTLKIMKEFLRLESDLGYRIPRGKRLWYVARNRAKWVLFQVAGAGIVERVVQVKRRIRGPRS